jgi:hypothetical protein
MTGRVIFFGMQQPLQVSLQKPPHTTAVVQGNLFELSRTLKLTMVKEARSTTGHSQSDANCTCYIKPSARHMAGITQCDAANSPTKHAQDAQGHGVQ